MIDKTRKMHKELKKNKESLLRNYVYNDHKGTLYCPTAGEVIIPARFCLPVLNIIKIGSLETIVREGKVEYKPVERDNDVPRDEVLPVRLIIYTKPNWRHPGEKSTSDLIVELTYDNLGKPLKTNCVVEV